MAIVRLRLFAVFFWAIGITPAVYAQSISSGEKQKIEALIKYVAEMNDAKFVRNGASYDAKSAATFLRRKWAANDSAVKTARDFIDKIASVSGTSGKPYIIRFQDGREVKSRDMLLAALEKIEKPTADQTGASTSGFGTYWIESVSAINAPAVR
jgi:hypothetical protein